MASKPFNERLHNARVRRNKKPGMQIHIIINHGFNEALCVINGRDFKVRRSLTGTTTLEGVKADEETEGTFAGMVASRLHTLLDSTFDAGKMVNAALEGKEQRAGRLLKRDLWAQLDAACVEEVFEAMTF